VLLNRTKLIISNPVVTPNTSKKEINLFLTSIKDATSIPSKIEKTTAILVAINADSFNKINAIIP
jgi:hypothetical protein